jgi:hypothetical protein
MSPAEREELIQARDAAALQLRERRVNMSGSWRH